MRYSIMKKLALVALFLASQNILSAQENLKAWPGPKGVFLFTGNAIATGKPLSSYLIERSDSNNNWVKVEELKLPATSQEFLDKVNLSKSLFPDQPLPMQA
ncbi:MAG TPA: hypothetical protein PLP88_04945, partial [Bacteroidales bacterium]|nr:hypothetical protein [Bacteroidales bacterium]